MTSDAGESSAAGYLERASALNDFRRPEEAIAELRRGLTEHPQDPELLGLLAWLLLAHGGNAEPGGERAAQAERAAKDALAARPHDWRGLTVLCELAAGRGLPDEALGFAAAQVEHYPDWASGHLNVAYALLSDKRRPRSARKSRHVQVRESLHRALELAPEDSDTLRRATVMLRRIGDREAASETLDRALQLDPTDQELLLLAAERAGEQPETRLYGLGAVSAAHEAEALRLLSGVAAESPEHRGAARAISDQVWRRTQWLATFPMWLLAALMLFAFLVFGEVVSTSSRTRVKGLEAILLLPLAWLLLFVTIRRTGLPKRFMRRLYRPVWWVWIGLVFAALGGLAMLVIALTLLARSGETALAMQGGYVAGITASIGVVAGVVLVGELLIVFARFRSERVTGLYPAGIASADAESLAAAGAELRGALWGLVRTGIAVLLLLVPIVAAPFATRPEAAGGFAAVAVALGTPPLVVLLLRFGRWQLLRGGRSAVRVSHLAIVCAVVVAIGAVAGTWGYRPKRVDGIPI